MNIGEIKKRLSSLKSERSNWETLWQDIGDYIFTRKNTVLVKRTQGEDRQFYLYDNTGPQSLELLAGNLHSLLTSSTQQWFELTTGDEHLDSLDDVRLFLQKLTTKTHNILNNSNFQMEVHELYMDIGGFGTGLLAIEPDEEDVVRFLCKFIAVAYIKEDSRGRVNEVYLEYEWNARQIVQEYGVDALSDKVKRAYDNNEDTKFKVVHAVYPMKEKDARGFTYESVHCLLEEKHELKRHGFKELPFVVPRWSKASGETYGRSPAMVALPEVKVLNKMVETTLIGAEKVVDPPLQAPDDGFISQLNTFPGGISYYRAGSNDQIRPVFNDSRIDFGFQVIQEKQSKIRDAFYVNQLQLRTGPQMTATEVMQRTEEQMRFLGPFLGRMQSEFLRPLLDRVVDIMFSRGVIDPREVPPIIRSRKIDVRYSSFVAKSQRVGEGQNIMRFVQTIEPFINADQSAVDNLNADGAINRLSIIYGVPQDILRNKKELDNVRKARAEAQQQMASEQKQMLQAEQAQKLGSVMAQKGNNG